MVSMQWHRWWPVAVIAACATSPLRSQGAVPATSAQIEAMSVTTGKSIEGAYCFVRSLDTGSEHAGVTNAVGRVTLFGLVPNPNVPLPVPDDPEASMEQERGVRVQVAAAGFLPLEQIVALGANNRVMQVQLVPDDIGFVTPLIKAAIGGNFSLPGLGTLSVPPNVLGQDAVIRIVPIPFGSMAHGLVDGDIRYQVWCQALDALGQPLPGVLPAQHSGIVLAIELDSHLPSGATDEQWHSHALGHFFGAGTVHSEVGTLEGGQRVALSICEGYVALTHDYTVAEPMAGCDAWGPWRVQHTLRGVTKEVVSQRHFKCGYYMMGGTVGRGTTVEHTLTHTISEETCIELGFQRGFVLGRASGKYTGGNTVTNGRSTTTLNTFEDQQTFALGDMVSGFPAGSVQPAGWNSVSGRVEWGYLISRYQVWAWRHRNCIGGRQIQKRNLGFIEECSPFDKWFADVSWDSTCPGCPSTGAIPPDMRIY